MDEVKRFESTFRCEERTQKPATTVAYIDISQHPLMTTQDDVTSQNTNNSPEHSGTERRGTHLANKKRKQLKAMRKIHKLRPIDAPTLLTSQKVRFSEQMDTAQQEESPPSPTAALESTSGDIRALQTAIQELTNVLVKNPVTITTNNNNSHNSGTVSHDATTSVSRMSNSVTSRKKRGSTSLKARLSKVRLPTINTRMRTLSLTSRDVCFRRKWRCA